MDNPRIDDADGQPASASVNPVPDDQPASVNLASVDPAPGNPVPDPSIDITRTAQWVSVRNNGSLDVGTAAVLQNLHAIASLIQATQKMHLDDAKRIKKLEADNRIMKADLRHILRALGEDTASEASRRSSMNSRRASLGSRTSSVGGATVDEDEDPAEVALGKFLDALEEIDTYFESFILSSGKTALTKHTKNLSVSSQAFKDAANVQLAGFIGDQRASEILEYMSIFGEKQLEEAYMAMSRRYNASKKKGKGKGQSKKATTVNEGFVTDVSGRGGDGSQSTDLNSPRKTRAPPKTPRRPRTRRAVAVDPEDIEEE